MLRKLRLPTTPRGRTSSSSSERNLLPSGCQLHICCWRNHRTVTDGTVIIISVNMIEQTRRVQAAHAHSSLQLRLLGDFTFKIGFEGWGLATLALPNKHSCATTGVPVSEAVPMAYAWAPKECAGSWGGVLITMVDVYEKLGRLDFSRLLRGIILELACVPRDISQGACIERRTTRSDKDEEDSPFLVSDSRVLVSDSWLGHSLMSIRWFECSDLDSHQMHLESGS